MRSAVENSWPMILLVIWDTCVSTYQFCLLSSSKTSNNFLKQWYNGNKQILFPDVHFLIPFALKEIRTFYLFICILRNHWLLVWGWESTVSLNSFYTRAEGRKRSTTVRNASSRDSYCHTIQTSEFKTRVDNHIMDLFFWYEWTLIFLKQE